MNESIYDIPLRRIDGTPATLGEFCGKVVLVVNVASGCGLTPQYDGLEKPGSGFRAKLASYGVKPENESDILWNFERFLIDRQGKVAGRFAPDTAPKVELLREAVERALRS